MPDAVQATLHTALGLARRWRQANPDSGSGAVVIVLDGQFVGSLASLPSPAEWAPGCLAVAADGQIHLARPASFRGEVELADLGVFAPEKKTGGPAATAQTHEENGSLDS